MTSLDPPYGAATLLAGLVLVAACGPTKPTPAPVLEIRPYDAADARQSPFAASASGAKPSVLPELASVRFQNGLRAGMSVPQLERLAGKRGRLRQLPDGKQEWTVAWPGEGTGFRVQLRDGKAVAWMQASALAVQ